MELVCELLLGGGRCGSGQRLRMHEMLVAGLQFLGVAALCLCELLRSLRLNVCMRSFVVRHRWTLVCVVERGSLSCMCKPVCLSCMFELYMAQVFSCQIEKAPAGRPPSRTQTHAWTLL